MYTHSHTHTHTHTHTHAHLHTPTASGPYHPGSKKSTTRSHLGMCQYVCVSPFLHTCLRVSSMSHESTLQTNRCSTHVHVHAHESNHRPQHGSCGSTPHHTTPHHTPPRHTTPRHATPRLATPTLTNSHVRTCSQLSACVHQRLVGAGSSQLKYSSGNLLKGYPDGDLYKRESNL